MAPKDFLDVDVAIIGAGWYGLVAARTYLRLRAAARLIILDSDETVGGVWSKDRLYPNLVAQVKLGLFNYSDTPMPPYNGDPSDPRVTGDMIHEYMHKYAEEHDLIRRIRFNTFITSATKSENGWTLKFRDSTDVLHTEKLMVATGVTSIPQMPRFPGNDDSMPTIHSRDLGTSFETLKSKPVEKVIVVGAAKSAYDAVYLLLSMGKQVTWIVRTEGAGPLAILPFAVLGLINSIAFASTRLSSHLSPSILNTHGWLYWFLQRTILGRWLVALFWHFLDYVSRVHAGYNRGDHVCQLRPEISRQGVFWAHSGLGVVTLPNFWDVLHGKRLTILRDEIDTIRDGSALFKSGSSCEADFLVLCTGWGDHFGMFDAQYKTKIGLPLYNVGGPRCHVENEVASKPTIDWPHFDEAADIMVDQQLPFLASPPKLQFHKSLNPKYQRKFRLYRRVVPVEMALAGDRSIAILGQIHTVQTPLVSEVQSLWAILYLLGEIELPDADTMATEISLWNAWTRKRYLNQGQKFPYSLYDFLPYIDSLFRDVGLESRRKSNIFSEIFTPYYPHDFNGFVDECLAKRGYYV